MFSSDFVENECVHAISGAIITNVFEIEMSQLWKIRSKATKTHDTTPSPSNTSP
jgi:hypothetical protein